MAQLVDQRAEPTFDRYARMVQRALGVPVSLVSIVEANRQVMPGAAGLPEPLDLSRELTLPYSLCKFVVASAEPLIVNDARADPALADNLGVRDLGVVAYAGIPITDHTGTVIGSLCAIDSRPREWAPEEVEELQDLAASCSAEMAQRELRRQAVWREGEAQSRLARGEMLLSLSEALYATSNPADIGAEVDRIATAQLGCRLTGVWLSADADEEVRRLARVRVPGPRPPGLGELDVVDLDATSPFDAVVDSHAPSFFDSPSALAAAFPDFARRVDLGESVAFLPLALEPQASGVLVLAWADRLRLDDLDRTTVTSLSTYTAQALHRALLLEERVHTSLTLQQAMLTRLPHQPGLTLATRYRPAAAREQVGGDWYDALALPSGDTGLVTGDVVGHDIEAAADMGQLRSILRALAWSVDESPARTLERVDQVLPGLDLDMLATLVYARIVPPDPAAGPGPAPWRLVWSNAGHPPPLLVAASGEVRLLEEIDQADADVMLGVLPGPRRQDRRTEVEPGATLLLHTDGLVERRDASLAAGTEALARACARHHGRPLEGFLDAVLAEVLPDVLTDDVAVLAARFA